MRRIIMLATVALVMALMLVAMGMPASAFPPDPDNHVLETGDCGNGNCTGFGVEDFLPSGIEHHGEDQSEDPGRGQSGETGDERNNVCFDHGFCIGTNNN
jgi:hypothetical protein